MRIVGCSNRSGREKGVSFFRIPSIITHRTAKLGQGAKHGTESGVSGGDI